jgi:DNA polymerase-3 subunit beta
MRIVIKKNVLQAMSILASKKDVRYYLNGVCVIATENHVRYVATDGHILGLYQQDYAEGEEKALGSLIIPNETIAKLIKDADIILDQINGQWVVGAQLFTPIDGKFPDYQRVLPRGEISNEVAQFNPDFITRFQKVGKLLAKNAVPTIAHNGGASALVDIGLPNFVGVMMPIRTEKPLAKTPLAFLDNVSV